MNADQTSRIVPVGTEQMIKKRRRALRWPTASSPMCNMFVILVLMAWSESCVRQHYSADAFISPRPSIAVAQWSKMSIDSSPNGQDEASTLTTLSNSAIGGTRKRRESRLRVRRRVKAVLEKARIRTGVRNGSVPSSRPPPPRSAPTVIAEAASIGGLGDGSADIVFTERNQTLPSTSSSPATRTNGATNGLSNTTVVGSEKGENGSSATKTTNTTKGFFFPDEELGLRKKEAVVNGAQNVSYTNGASTPTTAESNGHGESSNSKTNGASDTVTDVRPRKPREFDVIRGDMPSANAFVEPLPFKLPELTKDQKLKLVNGKRIQEQSRMGREGSGYVVMDVEAPPYVVWECLLDFESYPELIPTVKSMQLYTSTKLNTGFISEKPVLPGTGRETRHYGTPSITRASFILSKFRFNIAAIHRYTPHPQGDYMVFTLDPSCTNMVLKGAKGTWYTEENPDGRKGVTRVYLLAGLQISRALPKFVVDYAAERAMPRATKWLRPEVEALKAELFSDKDP
mmetsp:Transcript_1453/g.3737  ORF Transcript_1453/g.3737 Transcript_1453/m.3737 type:complete len:514 (+) Transcript_1453:255-1796(+)|eukprot:CAMPEP_0172360412 /NCGR_PEP_ID=MMETSP1060-20121228/4434_1 /TAXON_ID=37318 /ORGANISM="Pseudo-nitzschia pungens, Strain cf. cingulata" /LENGTH=513 /DNA_ID=CAMNT_0013082395 /DNA_START=229 /DNA_END=1770 /DNA_ORIENTATION=-